MKRTPTRLLAVGLAAGIVALSSCGDDGDDSEPADATAATAVAEEATTDEATTDEATTDEATTDEEMTDEEMTDEEMAATVVDVAIAEDFTTLVAAVEAAGLGETLSGEGPFTVFAPTDEAFAALPDGLLDALLLPENKDSLTAILTYHVVPGTVLSTDLTTSDVTTVEGEDVVVVVVDAGVTVNGANVVAADVKAGNGVVHVIDAVLVPPSIDPAALLG